MYIHTARGGEGGEIPQEGLGLIYMLESQHDDTTIFLYFLPGIILQGRHCGNNNNGEGGVVDVDQKSRCGR